jgi:hypothetical protein
VTLSGETALHARLAADDAFLQNARALAEDIASDELWIEKLRVHTRPVSCSPGRQAPMIDETIDETADAHEPREQDALAELLGAIAAAARGDGDGQALLELTDASGIAELRSKLPPELRESEEGFALDDPAFLAQQLAAAVQLLEARLLGESTARTTGLGAEGAES